MTAGRVLAGRYRLLDELCAGSFADPNIVSIFDVQLTGDEPFIVLELLDGETLDRTLQKDCFRPSGSKS